MKEVFVIKICRYWNMNTVFSYLYIDDVFDDDIDIALKFDRYDDAKERIERLDRGKYQIEKLFIVE